MKLREAKSSTWLRRLGVCWVGLSVSLVVIGCDPSSNHPVIASRMRRAIDENGARLIVVNPRRIDLCDRTDLWLRPFPGTDVSPP